MRLSGVICCLVLTTVAVAQDLKPFAGEVTASRLKLRAGPGPSYQPVITIDKGSRVIVLGKHANNAAWYYVEVPQGYTGWVSGRYVSKDKSGYAQVTTTRLLVRPRPSCTEANWATCAPVSSTMTPSTSAGSSLGVRASK